MAKTVTAIKDILKREELLLTKLVATVTIMAHKESKAAVRIIIAGKRSAIKSYKAILKASAKCPAIKPKAAAKTKAKTATAAKAVATKKAAPKKAAAKKKAAPKKAAAKKTASKKKK